jgi:hypothetical protein
MYTDRVTACYVVDKVVYGPHIAGVSGVVMVLLVQLDHRSVECLHLCAPLCSFLSYDRRRIPVSTSEPEHPDTSSNQAHEQSAQRGRLDKWLKWLPVLVVAVVLIARLAVLVLQPGWQTFRDPLGLFTVRYPPGWNAESQTNYATFGDPYGSATDPWESVTVREASHGAGGASVSIDAGPIYDTAFEHQWYCQAGPGSNNNGWFRIYPATYFLPDSWVFYTGNAHFQIDITIPDILEPQSHVANPPSPKLVPAPWVAADITYVTGILDSFHPSDLLPHTC